MIEVISTIGNTAAQTCEQSEGPWSEPIKPPIVRLLYLFRHKARMQMNSQVYRVTEMVDVTANRLRFSSGERLDTGVVLRTAVGSLVHIICHKSMIIYFIT